LPSYPVEVTLSSNIEESVNIEESIMATRPVAKIRLHLIAGFSLALLVAAGCGAAFARGGGGGSHNGGGRNHDGNSEHYFPLDRNHQYRKIKSYRPSAARAASSDNPVVFRPRRFRPPTATVGTKKLPPSPTGCPGCANPNLPPGAPIYVDDGHKHCVFPNGGIWGGCDPNIPDTNPHGSGSPEQGRHHLN
jgi:hypothetical protein